MYSIPYGTVLKLRELNLSEEKDKLSGRTVPHFAANGQKWAIIDNGFVNGFHWRFFKGSYAKEFRFSEQAFPFVLTLTPTSTECKNKYGDNIWCEFVDEGMLVISILRAFYPGNYGDIKIDDKRSEIEYKKLRKEEVDLLEQKDKIEVRLHDIQQRLDSLESQKR